MLSYEDWGTGKRHRGEKQDERRRSTGKRRLGVTRRKRYHRRKTQQPKGTLTRIHQQIGWSATSKNITKSRKRGKRQEGRLAWGNYGRKTKRSRTVRSAEGRPWQRGGCSLRLKEIRKRNSRTKLGPYVRGKEADLKLLLHRNKILNITFKLLWTLE